VNKRRLDIELVRRGLAPARASALEIIDTGRVLVGGAPALKAARLVGPGEAIVVLGERPRFVSRGGEKLDGALDAGASTGGFTDCLLQRGAREVVAVDVGRGQLHERLTGDPRIRSLERQNVRNLTPEIIGGRVDVVVADLSFISLTKVADALLRCLRPGGDLVWLVKPQFEAGRAEASRGRGVIRDEAVREAVRDRIDSDLRSRGATMLEWTESPIPGAEGNRELFVHARASADDR
jgi:23S rRNA (cytidine1920-2'-O)/16S rRNA (cytidine1409-2'-O)-methyltransferase